mmetsp:Transcript_26022/g.59254  ORF Transcript_26022/g.59254 Transcript_26022/m.59254 type:complete len:208 (+) Transcript_26022:74-697(+)
MGACGEKPGCARSGLSILQHHARQETRLSGTAGWALAGEAGARNGAGDPWALGDPQRRQSASDEDACTPRSLPSSVSTTQSPHQHDDPGHWAASPEAEAGDSSHRSSVAAASDELNDVMNPPRGDASSSVMGRRCGSGTRPCACRTSRASSRSRRRVSSALAQRCPQSALAHRTASNSSMAVEVILASWSTVTSFGLKAWRASAAPM